MTLSQYSKFKSDEYVFIVVTDLFSETELRSAEADFFRDLLDVCDVQSCKNNPNESVTVAMQRLEITPLDGIPNFPILTDYH